jgi:hypothetical protein
MDEITGICSKIGGFFSRQCKMNSNHSSDKNENKSEVANTLTLDCFLNAFSCAQIGQSSFNANAKYSRSILTLSL